jgi:hypothetical protein
MDQEAVRELARLIADQIVPAEADEFDSQADAWFADPNRAATRDPHGGGPLGFGGLEEIANDAVPIILYISAHLLSAAAEISAAEGIRRVLGRGRRDKTADGPEAPTLNAHEIAAAYGDDPEAVRSAVRAAGEEYGADAALIEKIADRVPTLLDL